MADVFIGYAEEDEAIARALSGRLEAVRVSAWYARRDVAPGDVIALSIANAMQQCKICVFIFSESGVCSKSLLHELQYAIKQVREERRNIRLIPLLIDEEGKSVLSERILNGNQWFDATVPPLQDRLREFARLIWEQLNKPKESAS